MTPLTPHRRDRMLQATLTGIEDALNRATDLTRAPLSLTSSQRRELGRIETALAFLARDFKHLMHGIQKETTT